MKENFEQMRTPMQGGNSKLMENKDDATIEKTENEETVQGDPNQNQMNEFI